MKINKLKINAYGKIKDKEIDLKNGVNIIYGENESGKSTLLKFISNMLFGISKNKNGKEYSDFEKYKPWNAEEFSGKIDYELDNEKKFEVFRDFKKKSPQIINENKEDITKEFSIDKIKGNQFFYEQTKMDETLFLSTILINQAEVRLEKNDQNILIQKIANLVGTGEDNVSYKRAIDRINRRQLDEIGTERSREKPLNLLLKENQKLEEEKLNLEKYKNNLYDIEEDKKNILENFSNLQERQKYLNEIKLFLDEEKIEFEKIKIKENIKNENNKKINENKNKIVEIENNKKILEEKNNKKINNILKNKNKLKNNLIILMVIILLLNIFQFILIKNNIFKYIFLLTVPTTLIFIIIYLKIKNKHLNNIKNENNLEIKKIENEINNYLNENKIIEKNNNQLEKEINEIKNILEKNKEKKLIEINNNYLEKIEKNIFNNYDIIINELENIQKNINDSKIKLNNLDYEKQNLEISLENLVSIEEKIVDNNKKIVNLKKLNESMDLAKELLAKAYEKMKNTVTPKFTENLSKNIEIITNGKYKYVTLQEDNGLIVQLEDGRYIEANRLSIGTIDQLYLSLRLSMVDDLSTEKMPIILDEAFAYYDTARLKNILEYLSNMYSDRQIIIFTCTNREKEIFNEVNIKYNFIEL